MSMKTPSVVGIAAALWNRVESRSYTWLMRRRFHGWGRGSQVHRPTSLAMPQLIRVGDNVVIREHVWLNAKDDRLDGQPTLFIGDGTYVGRFVQINAWRNVTIGSHVLIADRVYISDADHRFSDPNVPIILQGDEFSGPVRLCSGCWVGIGAVILPGVTIGHNAIVGANAVVTGDVPDDAIVAGVPAKVISRRASISA